MDRLDTSLLFGGIGLERTSIRLKRRDRSYRSTTAAVASPTVRARGTDHRLCTYAPTRCSVPRDCRRRLQFAARHGGRRGTRAGGIGRPPAGAVRVLKELQGGKVRQTRRQERSSPVLGTTACRRCGRGSTVSRRRNRTAVPLDRARQDRRAGAVHRLPGLAPPRCPSPALWALRGRVGGAVGFLRTESPMHRACGSARRLSEKRSFG